MNEEPDIYNIGHTEAHLIDRELNEEVVMLPGPPPSYYCMAHWGGDIDINTLELDTSEPIIKISYKLYSKKCLMDGMLWIAEYRQCF